MSDLRGKRGRSRVPRAAPYVVAEIVLLALLGWATARLLWVLLASVGPIGLWPVATSGTAAADRSLMARFDPFFRLTETGGPTVVTALPLKLNGTRVDQAMGRGAAIITTPDGQQASFAVGDEIVPGVILKSVAFDSVTIERGGVAEQLFLDQSKPAIVAGAPEQPAAGATQVPAPQGAPSVGGAPSRGPPPPTMPSMPGGAGAVPPAVQGYAITPQTANGALATAGLQAGDVVTQINGAAIRSGEDVARSIAGKPAGSDLSLSVSRGGRTITITTKVPQ